MLLRGPSSSCAAAAVARRAGLPSQASRAAMRAPLARAPLVAARPSSLSFAARSSSSSRSKLCAISKPTDAAAAAPVISIDNGADSSATVVRVAGANRPGLLTALTAAFRDLGLDVKKVLGEEKRKKDKSSFVCSALGDVVVAHHAL